MTSDEFDDLSNRAQTSLRSSEIETARSVDDIQLMLDQRFFGGGSGDRMTRFGISVSRLVAADIFRKTESERITEPEGETGLWRDSENQFVQVIKEELIRPLIRGLRGLPLIQAIRRSIPKPVKEIRKAAFPPSTSKKRTLGWVARDSIKKMLGLGPGPKGQLKRTLEGKPLKKEVPVKREVGVQAPVSTFTQSVRDRQFVANLLGMERSLDIELMGAAVPISERRAVSEGAITEYELSFT